LLVGLISAFLVILEPDLGTGLIIAASVIIGSFVKMLKGRNTNMIWTVIIAAIVFCLLFLLLVGAAAGCGC